MKKVVLPILLLLPILWPAPGSAEFYRYLGEDGRPVYVDDIGKVPPEYRDQIRRYTEAEKADADRSPVPGGDALIPAPLQPGEMTAEVTPVLVKGDRVFVPATIGYGILQTEVLLVLDTGASVTTLFRPSVETLFMRGLNRTTGRTASGHVVEVELATLDFIRVGPHRREHLRAGIVDTDGKAAGYDGLLGMDFLRGLDFNIDFERELIVWR
ncbi:MAG: retropepsin-like aspartic protease [Desulfobacterales bacterium]|jgi:hypothetical protein